MIKKIAIFTEGQTEQIFITKLLIEIAGAKNIKIDQEKKTCRNTFCNINTINATSRNTQQKYYVLIRDCGSDNSVNSEIRDACENLSEVGHEKIIGLRDVYPENKTDIPKIESAMRYHMPTKFVPIKIILAIMEIEAWFLADVSHFVKIHPSLTLSKIIQILNFDPTTANVEDRNHPAEDLDNIYKSVGFRYTKIKRHAERTIKALDYEKMYLDLIDNVSSLKKLILEIDSFLD